MEEKIIKKRKLTGTVVSTKMNKTVVVRVDRVVSHPKYKVRHTSSKNFKVHDERQECKEGDVVVIEECRPLSKDKHFRVIKRMGVVIQQ